MPNKTNQEWIEDNNDKIDDLITLANDLPNLPANIEPIYVTQGSPTRYGYNLTSYNIDKTQGSYAYTFVYKDVIMRCGAQRDLKNHYIFAKGDYYGNIITDQDAYAQHTQVIYYDDDCCYLCMCKGTDYSKNRYLIAIDFINKTATLGNVSLPMNVSGSSVDYYGWLLPERGGVIRTSYGSGNITFATYNKDNNTFATIGYTGSMSSSTSNRAPNYIMYSSYSGGYINKLVYNENTEKIDVTKRENYTVPIRGVNWYGNKIFVNKNVYELNADLTIGNLLKENAVPAIGSNSSGNYYSSVVAYSSDLYVITYNSNTTYLYTFDEDTNTFTRVNDLGANTYYIPANGVGYNSLVSLDTSKYILTSYNWEDEGIAEIGFKYNDYSYFFKNQYSARKYDKVLVGTTVYDEINAPYEGSMPNNGVLNYTPTTSQQTIPAGYTSGGTISAVSMTEQEIQQAEDIISDLFGEGENE